MAEAEAEAEAEAFTMMVKCLRAYEYIMGEFARHHAQSPAFAARLLPGCHSSCVLFASWQAACVWDAAHSTASTMPQIRRHLAEHGVPNPLPPPP
jgi:hypothetical protein